MDLGYSLICEEHPPERLVEHAVQAEEAGLSLLAISDHFHPWLDEQGHSPFAWSVLGALTERTRLPLVTLVTCPIKRYHPAVVAQMAATVARMAPAGLTLGLGSGENLNEHVVGGEWPAPTTRLSQLEEAVEVIRDLFSGRQVTHRGEWFTVDRARLYTLPDQPPPVSVAAGGTSAAELAGRVEAGLVLVSPDEELVATYREAGGSGPVIAQATVCWAEDEAESRRLLHERWRQGVMGWDANADLATPEGFASATKTVRSDDVVGSKPIGPEPKPYLESLRQYAEVGVDRVVLHNVGPDQRGFLEWVETELLPRWRA